MGLYRPAAARTAITDGIEASQHRILEEGMMYMAAFFFLSTHMHENHLFMAMPLLIAVAGRDARLARLAGLCSLAVFLNMVLHDPDLPQLLPGILSRPTSIIDPHFLVPYTWLQVVGSFLNSLLVGWVAGRACFLAWKLSC